MLIRSASAIPVTEPQTPLSSSFCHRHALTAQDTSPPQRQLDLSAVFWTRRLGSAVTTRGSTTQHVESARRILAYKVALPAIAAPALHQGKNRF